MKSSNLTKEEKIHIVNDFMSNTLSAKEMAEKYGLSSPSVLRVWKFRYLKDGKNLVKPEKKPTFAPDIPDEPKQESEDTMAKKMTYEELEAEYMQMGRDLAWERLRNKALNTLIDVTERQGIQIRKKTGAKQ